MAQELLLSSAGETPALWGRMGGGEEKAEWWDSCRCGSFLCRGWVSLLQSVWGWRSEMDVRGCVWVCGFVARWQNEFSAVLSFFTLLHLQLDKVLWLTLTVTGVCYSCCMKSRPCDWLMICKIDDHVECSNRNLSKKNNNNPGFVRLSRLSFSLHQYLVSYSRDSHWWPLLWQTCSTIRSANKCILADFNHQYQSIMHACSCREILIKYKTFIIHFTHKSIIPEGLRELQLQSETSPIHKIWWQRNYTDVAF